MSTHEDRRTGGTGATRRAVLRQGGLAGAAFAVAACSQAAVPAAAPIQPSGGQGASGQPAEAAWQKDWDTLVAAANREGSLALVTLAGVGYRKWVDDFQAAFPNVQVQLQQFSSSNLFVPRVLQEREAGIYGWDIIITSSTIAIPQLGKAGVLEPLRPMLFHPDATGDRGWNGGFEIGWMDSAKQLGYAFTERLLLLPINTDMVNPDEIKHVRDMANPKWKGKIIMADVRAGFTFGPMNAVRVKQGEEMVRKLMIDQEPVFNRDNRQITDLMVRGRYAIGTGVTRAIVKQFLDEGLGKNIKFIEVEDWSYITHSESLWAINRPPHPNAAKLFANWMLTQPGIASYVKHVETNSRRLGVPPADPEEAPKAGKEYYRLGPEASIADSDKTQQLLQQLAGLRGE